MIKQSVLAASVSLLFASFVQAAPSVQCWGNNYQGQTDVPADLVLRTPPKHPVEIRNSNGRTCFLEQTGKVSCWGAITPDVLQLQSLENVKSFYLGDAGACAITASGVQCFDGILSDGGSIETVVQISNPIAVVVGASSACALNSSVVQCWGPGAISTTPLAVSSAMKMVFGPQNLCVLSSGGGVKCFGNADTKINSVPLFLNATDIFMASTSACATTRSIFGNFELKCWGNGSKDATTPTIPAPSQPTIYATGNSHVCTLDQTGVHCIGSNNFGQLDVPKLSNPTALYGNPRADQTCAIDDTGVVCWGENWAGQSSLSPMSSLSAGLDSTCAINQGKIECWGSQVLNQPIAAQDAYQVITGSDFACAANSEQSLPNSCWGSDSVITARKFQLDANPLNKLSISGGFDHFCANSGGNLFCVGNNDYGQSTPPTGLSVVTLPSTLSAGGDHTCAIDQTRGVVCWGQDEDGEIDVPTTLKNPRQVTSGYAHTCALDDNGVSCWGRSKEGQTTVPALKNPVSVQAGGYHSCAVDDDGLKCWGDNSFGQITVPTTLSKKVTNLTLGLFHTCAVSQ